MRAGWGSLLVALAMRGNGLVFGEVLERRAGTVRVRTVRFVDLGVTR